MSESTAPEGTPERWVVTVTRLDLRRGTLMLPYRLSGRFTPGDLACEDAATGETHTVTVQDARTIEGLGPVFQAHDVQVNDRMVLHVLDGPSLRVGFEKRTRAPRQDVQPSRWYSVHDDAPTVQVTPTTATADRDPGAASSDADADAAASAPDTIAPHEADATAGDDAWLVDDVAIVDADPAYGHDQAGDPSAANDRAAAVASPPDTPGVGSVEATVDEGDTTLDPFGDDYHPPSAPKIVRDRLPAVESGADPGGSSGNDDPFAAFAENDNERGPLERLGRFTRSLFAGNPSNLEVEAAPADAAEPAAHAPAVPDATAGLAAPAASDGAFNDDRDQVAWEPSSPLWQDDEDDGLLGFDPAPEGRGASGAPLQTRTDALEPDSHAHRRGHDAETPDREEPASLGFDAPPEDVPDGPPDHEGAAAGEEALFSEANLTGEAPPQAPQPAVDTAAPPAEGTIRDSEAVPSWLEPWRESDTAGSEPEAPQTTEAVETVDVAQTHENQQGTHQPEAATDSDAEAVLPSGVPVPSRSHGDEGDLRTRISRFLESPDMPMIARTDVVAKSFSLDAETAQSMLEDLAESPPRGLRLIMVRDGAWRIERTGF